MSEYGVRIKYGNFAPNAKENFVAESEDNAFDTLKQFQEYNLAFPNYGNPCEEYQTLLDGKSVVIPENPENENIGFWSDELSGEDGSFENPIVIAFVSESLYSSPGISFGFDPNNEIYPTRLSIEWYRGEEAISYKEFAPDSAEFSCENQVEYYDKIIVTFYSLNMPNNRLRVRSVDHGFGTWFEPKQLKKVKLIQEINPISSELSINTMDFDLVLDTGGGVLFQKKQALSVYHNGKLKATTFVKEHKRKSKNQWSVKSEDYIGLLDSIPYYGGIYNNAEAADVLSGIFTIAKIPYEIDESFANETITGYIPYTNCRNALMQIAFAIQAIIDTSNSDAVRVFALDDDVKQSIPLNRIMQGQSFTDEEAVTGVEVTMHSYKPITTTKNAYDAIESGTGEGIFVRFSEPLHNLSITNGEIIESGANYAIINANEDCVLTGQRYDHITQTKRKNNPLVTANDVEKIIAVENATLISQSNLDKIVEKCYNYYIQNQTINAKIVESKHIKGGEIVRYGEKKYGEIKYGGLTPKIITYDIETNVGDKIELDTEYLGKKIGRIIRQSFNLNGGTVIKDSVIR